MNHVFISYKRRDRGRARTLADALETSGWEVWWDEKLSASETFDDVLAKRISEAGCLIVLWSSSSVNSDFVKDEVRFAQDKKIPVVPVRIEDVDIPLGFQHLQHETLTRWAGDSQDATFAKLVRAIEEHIPPRGGLAPPERQRAVLVVVDQFPRWIEAPRLRTGSASARALKDLLLTEMCDWDDVEIVQNPDCRALQIVLERFFRQAEFSHQLLLYYFGHVAVAPDGRLYLTASDTEPDVLESTSIPLDMWLRNIVNHSKTDRTVIVLDADYQLAIPDETQAAKIDVSGEIQNHLGHGRGKYVMAATTQLETPIERDGEKLSNLTRYIVEGVGDGSADGNDDRIITAEEVLRYVRGRMAEEGHGHLPEGWSFEIDPEDLVMARREKGRSRPVVPLELDSLRIVRDHLVAGRCVPFIGGGIYGSGPLSPFLLSSALLQKAGLRTEDRYEIATAAQYLHEQHDDRPLFLRQLRGILDEQTRQAPASDIHSLILELDPPLLVISASYDFVLENRLAGQRPHILVSHVLSSRDGDQDGKLLVVKRGEQDEVSFCLSDRFDLDEGRDLVIYKILGSPYLHDFVEKQAEIDTVVATETDYMKLLGQLKNDNTSVPTAFSVPFSTRFLVFLGYTLDLWHYRLIAHIFERFRGKKRYAVRQPVSPIEISCWESLGVKVIHSEPRALAEMLKSQGLY